MGRRVKIDLNCSVIECSGPSWLAAIQGYDPCGLPDVRMSASGQNVVSASTRSPVEQSTASYFFCLPAAISLYLMLLQLIGRAATSLASKTALMSYMVRNWLGFNCLRSLV